MLCSHLHGSPLPFLEEITCQCLYIYVQMLCFVVFKKSSWMFHVTHSSFIHSFYIHTVNVFMYLCIYIYVNICTNAFISWWAFVIETETEADFQRQEKGSFPQMARLSPGAVGTLTALRGHDVARPQRDSCVYNLRGLRKKVPRLQGARYQQSCQIPETTWT